MDRLDTVAGLPHNDEAVARFQRQSDELSKACHIVDEENPERWDVQSHAVPVKTWGFTRRSWGGIVAFLIRGRA
ncbi:MAG TPA: hypothetical protein VE522_04500, partial [Actinomycetota bacterium]|nr:hypothetical protein [Actinomycetota bacterium]